MKDYKITDTIRIFPQDKGWHYIVVPKKITSQLNPLADRGLIGVTARIDDFAWKTSLLPMGDGTHFIPLSAKVRKSKKLTLGNEVTIHFTPLVM